MNSIWVVLVTFSNKQVNVSQEAYKTYNEAKSWILRKENIKSINDYIFYDEENECKYELKNVYIK